METRLGDDVPPLFHPDAYEQPRVEHGRPRDQEDFRSARSPRTNISAGGPGFPAMSIGFSYAC